MMLRRFNRLLSAAAVLMFGAVLSGCGGGGGAGGAWSTGSGGSTGTDAAGLQITTSTPSIGSDGRTSATIVAIVKDASNRTLANQQVDFSTTDAGARLQVANNRTDAAGQAIATLSIAEPSNRQIVVTATSGSLTQAVTIAVTGTTLTLSGPTNLVSNSPTEFTVGLRDSSGTIVVGRPVTIASSAGNAVSATSVTTDSAGQARFLLTGIKAGADRLTVSALGTTATAELQVSATQLSFVSPLASQELVVSNSQDVAVSYTVNNLPQPGQTVEFVSTRGTLSAASATTDAQGVARVTIQSPTAGASTITAQVRPASGGAILSSQRIEFVSRTPSKITVQPSPPAVGVNLSSSGTNSSQLIAVVRDAADNPVKGAVVSFSAVSDPSNGRIEPAVATSDGSGVATVAFYPGANSTGNNQIVVRAAVPGTALAATTSLTASKQELFVRAGTGNDLVELNLTTLEMPWSAVVTDANGNPVVGASIQASLLSTHFYKGRYYWSGLVWYAAGETSSVPRHECISEDLNGNLRLDAGEDLNRNNALDPGGIAAVEVVSTGAKTDASGLANLRLVYPKSYGNWVRVRLRVTITTIAGTEGTDEAEFILPVLASDVSNETVSPPGFVSRYGMVPDCATTD